jgi:hypothetical protein
MTTMEQNDLPALVDENAVAARAVELARQRCEEITDRGGDITEAVAQLQAAERRHAGAQQRLALAHRAELVARLRESRTVR